MKHSITLCAILFSLSFYSCKKDNTLTNVSSFSNPFFASAVQYLKSNLSANELDELDFTKSKIIISKNQYLGVQIFERGNTENKFLLLNRNKGNYSGNWVDMSGITKSPSHYSKGNIILISLDNSSITRLVVDSNEVIEMDKISANYLTSSTTYFKNLKQIAKPFVGPSPDVASSVLPEVIIYYDVDGGEGIDYTSWYWLAGQSYGDSYTYFSVTGGGGSGSSGPGYNNAAMAPTIFPPDSPISDLAKELKCFTDNSSSTYNISVNVNQPDPGTREVVYPTLSFPAGHTFLTLEQHNADGTSVIRSVGFYPKHSVKTVSQKDQSTFGDDSDTPYDVALSFTVTGSDMNKVINVLEDEQAVQYDLNEFNCTNSAMYALKAININLPDTKADDALFSGNDPGDLGEDIKNLNLKTFSAQNGNVKIIRTISNSDDQFPKANTGSCP